MKCLSVLPALCICALALSVPAAAFSGSNEASQSEEAMKPLETATLSPGRGTEQDKTELISEDGLFAVTLPEGFADARGMLDTKGSADADYQLEASCDAHPAYALFHAEAAGGANVTTFDDYFTVLAMGISGSELFSGVKLSAASDMTLKDSGLKCRKITFSAQYHPEDGGAATEVACWIYAIDGGDDFFGHFFCWSGSLLKTELDPVFDEMADTFRISDPGALPLK